MINEANNYIISNRSHLKAMSLYEITKRVDV